MNFSFIIKNENELDEIAQQILKKYNLKIFLFYGEMGVGKTRFIKSLCKGLDVLDVVSSPTFSIVNQYLNKNDDFIYHFDFYRTTNKEEIFDIGYEEYIYSSSYCFIEWPEKIESLLPNNYIKIEMILDGNNRKINIKEINNI
jgi:tRNA threonylcarbamoyladenosine biosynthesis protein TsaE